MVLGIDNKGNLSIYRKSGWAIQSCIYRDGSFCSHHCPLFGNPVHKIKKEERIVEFKICKKTFILDAETEFFDKRVKQD